MNIPDWKTCKIDLPKVVTDGSKSNVSSELKNALKAFNPSAPSDGNSINLILMVCDSLTTENLEAVNKMYGETVISNLPVQFKVKSNRFYELDNGSPFDCVQFDDFKLFRGYSTNGSFFNDVFKDLLTSEEKLLDSPECNNAFLRRINLSALVQGFDTKSKFIENSYSVNSPLYLNECYKSCKKVVNNFEDAVNVIGNDKVFIQGLDNNHCDKNTTAKSLCSVYGKDSKCIPNFCEITKLSLSWLEEKALMYQEENDYYTGFTNVLYNQCKGTPQELKQFDEAVAVALSYTLQSDNTILVVTSSDSSNGAPVFAAGCVVAEAARNISTLKEFISNAIENEMSGTKSNALPEMELPPGTGVKIPCWEKSKNGYTKANGYEDLDDYVTNLSDWKNPHGTNRTEKLKNAIHKAVEQGLFNNCSAKNIIVLLGDGMGESHLKASRNFYGKFVMDEIPNYCSALTESFVDEEGDLQTITDSGAGGTAIFCGEKTRYAYIGLDRKGNRVENIAEIARSKGKLVGSITNDHLGDATPASFLIHDTDRYHEHVIYTKEYLFAPDILMGTDCGIRNFLENDFNTALKNADEASKEYAETEDETYFSSEYFKNHKDEIIKECGVKSEEDFNKYPEIKNIKGYETFPEMVEKEFATGCKNRVVSFWDGNVPEYKPDSKVGFRMGENKKAPTFPEMVAFTLSFLDRKAKANGDRGFICMIENTCCDGWGHAQLVAPIINEVQCFDEGVAIACKFVLENPDTLLIITADHENADLHFRKGWEENYKKIISMSSGHSAQLVPVIAFGAKAKEYFPMREDNVVQEACLTGRNLVKILSGEA